MAVPQLAIRVIVSRCIEKTILWTIAHQETSGGPLDDLTQELVEIVRDELVKAEVPVQRKRRAVVEFGSKNPDDLLKTVQDYLPANGNFSASIKHDAESNAERIEIEGYDDHGWTLDEYVIPRLASGLIVAKEVS